MTPFLWNGVDRGGRGVPHGGFRGEKWSALSPVRQPSAGCQGRACHEGPAAGALDMSCVYKDADGMDG